MGQRQRGSREQKGPDYETDDDFNGAGGDRGERVPNEYGKARNCVTLRRQHGQTWCEMAHGNKFCRSAGIADFDLGVVAQD